MVKKAVIKGHKERSYKHKQFDFFYTRTCFRYMNEYYKEMYQQFVDTLHKEAKTTHKSLSHMSREEVEHNLRLFITHIFGEEVLASSVLTET